MTRPIIILGVDRSGTSLVAEMVHRWGAWGGDPKKLSRGDHRNPQGYWEFNPMCQVVGQLLRATEDSLFFPRYPEVVREKASDPHCRGKALQLIARMEREGRSWFWKEPFLSVQLPFWRQFWENPIYIVTVRHPYETALSWQDFILPPEVSRTTSIISANLLRWQFFMWSILDGLRGVTAKIFIPYDQLVRCPETQSRRLHEFLDGEHGIQCSDEGHIAKMTATVNPKHRSHAITAPFSEIAQATATQKELFCIMLRMIDDPGHTVDTDRYCLTPPESEYLENLRAFLSYYGNWNQALNSIPVRLAMKVGRGLRLASQVWRTPEPAMFRSGNP